MPAKSKAEQVAENRQRIREQLATEPDSDELQREVLEPEGVEVSIGGSPMRLYPLSGKSVRKLMGLTSQVFASSVGDGPPAMRIGGAIVEMYLDRFLPLLAEATQRAGSADDRQLARIQDELDRKTQSAKGAIELAAAFDIMLAQNDVLEVFVPKAQAAEE